MPLKYTDLVDPEWSTAALSTFKVSALPIASDPVVIELDGECPRCGHNMQHTEPLVAFRGVAPTSPEALYETVKQLRVSGLIKDKPTLPVEFSVRCECAAKHPDPLGRTSVHGCGAIWKVRIEPFDGPKS